MAITSSMTYANSGPGDPTIKLWLSRRARSQQFKQLFEESWKRNWRSYRAYCTPLNNDLDWWRENTVIPTVYKIIETLLPRYVLGLFNSPDFFTVEARQARDQDFEHLCETLLRTSLDKMNIFPKLYEALKYSLITGHCWGKSVWRESYEDRQVLVPTPIPMRQLIMDSLGQEAVDQAAMEYGDEALDEDSPVMGMETQLIKDEVFNGPDFEWRTLDRVFPDPTGEDRWAIEDIDTTLEQLEDVQEELGIYSASALRELAQSRRNQPGGDSALETDMRGSGQGGLLVGQGANVADNGLPI